MHLIHAFPFRLLKTSAYLIYVFAGRIVTDGNIFRPLEQRIICHLIDYLEVCFSSFFKPCSWKQMMSLK